MGIYHSPHTYPVPIPIVVKFEEINLKFKNVFSSRYDKVQNVRKT